MAEPYRILVTGSRTFTDEQRIYVTLDQEMTRQGRERPLILIHGACPAGADRIAATWAERARDYGWPVTAEPHPANWGAYGKAAGMRRNAEMVGLGADLCLAFIEECHAPACRSRGPHGSHGATYCAKLAERAGVETRRFGWATGER